MNKIFEDPALQFSIEDQKILCRQK